MKRLVSLFAIIGIFFASNCSRLPENNDPILGIWSIEATASENSKNSITTKQEWIFNDAYLGRFNVTEAGVTVKENDFSWEQTNGVYTLTYPADGGNTQTVLLKNKTEVTVLEDTNGTIVAIKE